MTAKYSALRNAGTFSGTIKAAIALREKRDANPPKLDALATPLLKRHNRSKIVIPLGTPTPLAARNVLAEYKHRNPRLREWSLGCEAAKETSLREIGSNSDMRKRSTFQRGVYVQSVGVACGRVLFFTLAGERSRITAPVGYRWDRDKNGLKLVSRTDSSADYHPTASELQDPIREIVAKLKVNVAARKAATKTEKHKLSAILRAEKEGATVCVKDSLRAGNCLAGTLNFATRHGLDSRRHYRPSEVLAIANGDASRVALVVTVALKRHREEMQRGYAVLADHVV